MLNNKKIIEVTIIKEKPIINFFLDSQIIVWGIRFLTGKINPDGCYHPQTLQSPLLLFPSISFLFSLTLNPNVKNLKFEKERWIQISKNFGSST